MADLFLHLLFARRLRLADGLHPIAGEALNRRPSLVMLGAALADLPGNERKGMGFLRRLFSRGGDSARWQKLLSSSPQQRLELSCALLAEHGGQAPIGPMARTALGLGALARVVVDEKVGPLTASVQGDRAAIERAQARLWAQAAVPRTQDLAVEWQPVVDLDMGRTASPEILKRVVAHVDASLAGIYGGHGPGDGALVRWMRGLVVEVEPLAQRAALPEALSMSDGSAQGPHFDNIHFVEAVQSALGQFVTLANRVGDKVVNAGNSASGTLERSSLLATIAPGGKLAEASGAEVESGRTRWKTWVRDVREASRTRGRNPKPAFLEGEGPVSVTEQRLASITKVMSLADLPPEVAQDTGAPPLPEASGPVGPPVPSPTPMHGVPAPDFSRAVTQEVSAAQIESVTPRDFSAPAHTQEVSLAQIEAASAEFATPAHTQEVSLAQIEASLPRDVPRAPASSSAAPAVSAEGAAVQKARPADARTDTHTATHASQGADPERLREGPTAHPQQSLGDVGDHTKNGAPARADGKDGKADAKPADAKPDVEPPAAAAEPHRE